MEIFSLLSFVIFVVASFGQADVVSGNSISTCGGIFEGDSGEFEHLGENGNSNANDSTDSSVCVWMIKLLGKEGAGVSLKLEDLDENSVVHFYAEGEPTDPVNTPITLNSSQINSAVELSGQIFIISLKSQLDQSETSATKFVVSWTSLQQLSKVHSKSKSSKKLPVKFTSTNYFAKSREKGRYNFKSLRPLQKSVWILDAGFGGSLDAEVNVQFDSSCVSRLKSKSKGKSGASPKSLCECSYFGLFEIVPKNGKLKSVADFCGRSGSSTLNKLSTQLVVFIYSTKPTSGSGEAVQISWERITESTNPTTTENPTTTTEDPTTATTTTEDPTTTTEIPSTEQPTKASTCPEDDEIYPCTCSIKAGLVFIQCSGYVNQTIIETVFREVRRTNGIPEDHGLEMNQFWILSESLTQLDLAPFYGSRIDTLEFLYSTNLTELVTSGNPRDHASIHVNNLEFYHSPIKRDGFGEVLKYFSNEMTKFYTYGMDLHLDNNNSNNSDEGDSDSESDSEFLPGLSAHTNLKRFALRHSNIAGKLSFDTVIPKELQKLQEIELEGNSLNEIGENVFDFYNNDFLTINLGKNKLNETSFHPNSGITKPGRQTTLYLSSTRITTLPSEMFQPFFDAHPQSNLSLYNTPLVCDERLSWLKSRREEFEQRVKFSECINDPGQTVFTSDLIP